MTVQNEEDWLEHAHWVRALATDVLRDAQRAEDVTQEALVAAWRGGWSATGDPVGLRRWLAATARNLARMTVRSESNRRAREADVAAARSASTEPIDARIAMQSRVAQAVATLCPEDREVVVLRYFDGLQPREIARRLNTTPNAVSSRLSRARQRLRAELGDDRLGDGQLGAWALAALGPGALRTSAPYANALPGASSMSASSWTWILSIAMKKLAIVAAVLASLLLLGGLWLTADPGGTDEVQATAPAARGMEPDVEVANLVGVAAANATPERSLASAPAEAPEPSEPAPADVPASSSGMGSVLVRVVSDETGLPLSDVGVSVRSSSASRWYDSLPAPTDQRGERLFRSLPEGKVQVEAWRTGATGEYGPGGLVDVLPNETAELTIRLGGGATIFGRVVDEQDRRVAGAEIWLSRGNGGPEATVLAGHADDRGQFELQHTGKLQCVSARAPGMQPSVQRMPHVVKPDEPKLGVKLVLKGLGGELRGRVVTTSGDPVAHALVKIESLDSLGAVVAGTRIKLPKGFAFAPAGLLLRTDEEGAFQTDNLGSGAFRIQGRGRATDLGRREIELALGGRAEVELVVGEAGSLSGVVNDHLGQPVPGATLFVYGEDWNLEQAETVTDEKGAYAVPALTTGSLKVQVATDRGKQGLEGIVVIAAGKETNWSPSLVAPLSIVGRALTSSGQPLVGFHVRGAAPAGAGPMATFHVDVQADGSFEAPNCLDEAYDLSLQLPGQWMGPALVQHTGVPAGTVDTEFVFDEALLPTASLHGRVVNGEDQPIPFQLTLVGQKPLVLIKRNFNAPNGEFRVPHLPPGEYELTFTAEGFMEKAMKLESPLDENEAREIPDLGLEPQ